MANDRNAGRKPKYNEKTVMMTFRIPKSQKDAVKKIVGDHMVKFLKGNVDVQENPSPVEKAISEKLKGGTSIVHPKISLEKPNLPTGEKNINKCDCSLDVNGLLRRGKIKCLLSKKDHNF